MTQASEQIARQYVNAALNRNTWGSILLNVRAFGAKGDGETDDTEALQACFNGASGQTVFFPDGIYPITQKLILPVDVNLTLSTNARIVAMAAMDKMIETPAGTFIEKGKIQGGTLDCNDLADIGLHVQFAQGVTIRDMVVSEARVIAYKIGSSTAASSSYECYVQNCQSTRPRDSVCLTGSIGLMTENCTDSHFIDCVFVGNEAGMDLSGGNHHLWGCHVWNHYTHGEMKWGFITRAPMHLTNCMADTATVYGYYLRASDMVLVNCRVYNGIWGPRTPAHPDGLWDNTQIGIYCEWENVSIIGCFFNATATTRILQDIYFQPARPKVTAIGCQHINVTTIVGKNRLMSLNLVEAADFSIEIVANAGMKAFTGVKLDGEEGSVARAMYVRTNGANKWRIGSDGGTGAGDAGLSFIAYPDGGGTIETLWFNRANGIGQFKKEMQFQDKVTMMGTYDKPLWLGSYALWINAGKLMIKSGAPSSITDGTVVGTQT